MLLHRPACASYHALVTFASYRFGLEPLPVLVCFALQACYRIGHFQTEKGRDTSGGRA